MFFQSALRSLVKVRTSGASCKSFSSSSCFYAKASFSAPTTPALLNTTYHNLLKEQVDVYPHKNFMASVDEDMRCSYSDAMKFQNAVAGGLVESNGIKGSSYVTALPLRSESLFSQVGSARADVDWAPLAPTTGAKDLENQLKLVNVGTFVWPPKVHTRIQLDEIYHLFPYFTSMPSELRIVDKRFPSLRQVLQTSKRNLQGMVMFPDMLVYDNIHSLNNIAKKIDPMVKKTHLIDDGEVVSLSERCIINTGYLVGHNLKLNQEDVVCTTIPLHTGAGLSLGLGMTLTHQAKIVYASDIFSASHTLEAMGIEFCTVLLVNAKNLEALLTQAKAKKYALDSLKKLVVVTSPTDLASPPLLQEALDQLGLESVTTTFGTNKTAGVISMTNPNQFDCVGKALPHTQVEIVDAKGNVVSVGQKGKLSVKGYNGSAVVDVVASLDSNNNICVQK